MKKVIVRNELEAIPELMLYGGLMAIIIGGSFGGLVAGLPGACAGVLFFYTGFYFYMRNVIGSILNGSAQRKLDSDRAKIEERERSEFEERINKLVPGAFSEKPPANHDG